MNLYKYTDKEMDQIIDSMVILVDTREQVNDHITSYFDKAKINWKKKKLDYGDYSFMIPKNEELSIPRDMYFDHLVMVERKGSLEEISGNLTKNRARFEEELALAPKVKVVYIEGNYDDMLKGNYDTSYNQKSFWASIHSFWHKYNCPFFFNNDKNLSGYFIRGFLAYYLKNYLKRENM